MPKKPDKSKTLGFVIDKPMVNRSAPAQPSNTPATPIYTKERAEAVRAYTAEWIAKNEPNMTAGKVEAYLKNTELFKL